MKKTVCILGAGQFGRGFGELLNTENLTLLAYGDNDAALQGQMIRQIPIVSVEEAVGMRPDCLLIGVAGEDRTRQLREQARRAGYEGEFLALRELFQKFDIRGATLCRIAERCHKLELKGAVAELGVYRGDLSWKLNLLFPDKDLYLFDTFEGFDERDLEQEKSFGFTGAKAGDFSDTSELLVRKRLPYPERAVIRKGYFPESARGLEGICYSLVSLDADLYAPIYAGLEYFYPRMASGGMLLLHDYQNRQFQGVGKAVEDYEQRYGRLSIVPLCDLHGSAVIIHE